MQVGGVAKGGVVCEIDRKLRVAFVGMARYGSKYTADNPMGELSPKDAAFETGKVNLQYSLFLKMLVDFLI